MAVARVTLFVPCLVDQVYPEIGTATLRILRHFGYEPEYEPEMTCCGQPAFNAGHAEEAKQVAGKFLAQARNAGTVVCPSGSCTAMVRKFYPHLFLGDDRLKDVEAVAPRTFEFSEFLLREGLLERVAGKHSGRVAFHNSCHSQRELGIADGPLALLRQIEGIELVGGGLEPACCGFGGLFSIKFSSIAAGMAKTRLESFVELGVRTLVSNDPGCIHHLRQASREQSLELEVLHLSEFLAQAMGL